MKLVGFEELQFGRLLPGFLQSLLLMVAIFFLHPPILWLIIIVVSYFLVLDAYNTYKGKLPLSSRRVIIQGLSTTGFIVVMVWLRELTGSWGFWGVLFCSFIIAIFTVWRRWTKIKPLVEWWERTYLGGTMEERRRKKRDNA